MNQFLIFTISLMGLSASAETWDGTNNPANLSSNYVYELSRLPLSGRISDQHMPWSDNYWESDWGGISFRWNTVSSEARDPDSMMNVNQYSYFEYTPPTEAEVKHMSREQLAKLSPAEKYDILMKRYDYPTVYSERERTGPGYDSWMGICHGWVPAAINHAEPLATDMDNGDGVIVPFGSTDVKGIMSYYYGVPAYDYARGAREVTRVGEQVKILDALDSFDLQKWINLVTESDVSFDYLNDSSACTNAQCFANNATTLFLDSMNEVGQIGQRPEKKRGLFGGTRGVQDPNAGAFHVVMANQLGLMNRAFIGNINKKIKNMEVWNQPIVGFRSQITSDRGGRHGRRVGVSTQLTYVSESPQSWEPVIGTPLQRYMNMNFSYTLDVDSYGNIIGGDWDNNQNHPSFAWKHDAIPFKGYFSKLKDLYKPRF